MVCPRRYGRAAGGAGFPSLHRAARRAAKVRIVEADGVDPQAYKRVTIATSDVPMVNSPTQVVVVDKDGNERPSAEWRVMLSDDGKTLSTGRAKGCAIILR